MDLLERENNRAQYIANLRKKNVGLGIVLALLFGGLGLFYASVRGGLLMTALGIIVHILSRYTYGLAGILYFPLHVGCVIWAIVVLQSHNAKLLVEVEQKAANSES